MDPPGQRKFSTPAGLLLRKLQLLKISIVSKLVVISEIVNLGHLTKYNLIFYSLFKHWVGRLWRGSSVLKI